MLRVPETKKFENNCSTGRDNQESKRKKRNKKIKRDKEEIKNWRGTEIDDWRHRNIKRRKRRPGTLGLTQANREYPWASGCGKVLTQDAVLQLPIGSHIRVGGPQRGKGLWVLALRHLQGEMGTPKGWGVVILILHSHSHCDMGQQRRRAPIPGIHYWEAKSVRSSLLSSHGGIHTT